MAGRSGAMVTAVLCSWTELQVERVSAQRHDTGRGDRVTLRGQRLQSPRPTAHGSPGETASFSGRESRAPGPALQHRRSAGPLAKY